MLDLGATPVGEYDEWGSCWITLRYPEGNEVCIAQDQPLDDDSDPAART